MFVGFSEINTSAIIKCVKHSGIIRTFCLPGSGPVKTCVCYSHQIFISPNDSPSKTEKCFLFYLKSSFRYRDIPIFVFLSFPLFLSVGHCFGG